jgi:hypothetical protein
MFCPSCGLEDRHANQFCRACGSDLRSVRFAMEKPDNITESAALARAEIGRAVAAKIRDAQTSVDLKIVAEDVLPEIEKFLESPEEKRMRRVRAGTIIAAIGLGVALMFLLQISNGAEAYFMVGLGIVAFFVGLSFIVNGLLFTVPKKILSDKSTEAERQRALDGFSDSGTNELVSPPVTVNNEIFSSVTEHTTHQLAGKKQSKP